MSLVTDEPPNIRNTYNIVKTITSTPAICLKNNEYELANMK